MKKDSLIPFTEVDDFTNLVRIQSFDIFHDQDRSLSWRQQANCLLQDLLGLSSQEQLFRSAAIPLWRRREPVAIGCKLGV